MCSLLGGTPFCKMGMRPRSLREFTCIFWQRVLPPDAQPLGPQLLFAVHPVRRGVRLHARRVDRQAPQAPQAPGVNPVCGADPTCSFYSLGFTEPGTFRNNPLVFASIGVQRTDANSNYNAFQFTRFSLYL